jgi:hypothetical protein
VPATQTRHRIASPIGLRLLAHATRCAPPEDDLLRAVRNQELL